MVESISFHVCVCLLVCLCHSLHFSSSKLVFVVLGDFRYLCFCLHTSRDSMVLCMHFLCWIYFYSLNKVAWLPEGNSKGLDFFTCSEDCGINWTRTLWYKFCQYTWCFRMNSTLPGTQYTHLPIVHLFQHLYSYFKLIPAIRPFGQTERQNLMHSYADPDDIDITGRMLAGAKIDYTGIILAVLVYPIILLGIYIHNTVQCMVCNWSTVQPIAVQHISAAYSARQDSALKCCTFDYRFWGRMWIGKSYGLW